MKKLQLAYIIAPIILIFLAVGIIGLSISNNSKVVIITEIFVEGQKVTKGIEYYDASAHTGVLTIKFTDGTEIETTNYTLKKRTVTIEKAR